MLLPLCPVTRLPVRRPPVSQSLLTPKTTETQFWPPPLLPSHSHHQGLLYPLTPVSTQAECHLWRLSLLIPEPRDLLALSPQRSLSSPASLSPLSLLFSCILSPSTLLFLSPVVPSQPEFPFLVLASYVLVIFHSPAPSSSFPSLFEVSLVHACKPSLLVQCWAHLGTILWFSQSAPLPPISEEWSFGGEVGRDREVHVDSLSSVYLKFSPWTWWYSQSFPLKRSPWCGAKSFLGVACGGGSDSGKPLGLPNWDLDLLRRTHLPSPSVFPSLWNRLWRVLVSSPLGPSL